jgi:tRNA pseudouridine55 synthase
LDDGLMDAPETGLCGVLVVDKPRGPTSHDVVARLRRALRTREIGHSGTLDPMATGVLVAAIGEATKLVPYLTGADKSYEATLALGIETDTLDAEGRETARVAVPPATLAALQNLGRADADAELLAALAAERARTSQVPPAFSAIKTDGERSHARARRGEALELVARPVTVHALEVRGGGAEPTPWLSIIVRAGKGYYVRSLARDLACRLGTVGHLTALRRTASGTFTVEDAVPPDAPADELAARMLPLARAAQRALPALVLTEHAAREARFGRPVPLDDAPGIALGPHAWLDPGGRLVAIGERDARGGADGNGRVLRGFMPPRT